MTYSMARFGAYEAFKDVLRKQCRSPSLSLPVVLRPLG